MRTRKAGLFGPLCVQWSAFFDCKPSKANSRNLMEQGFPFDGKTKTFELESREQVGVRALPYEVARKFSCRRRMRCLEAHQMWDSVVPSQCCRHIECRVRLRPQAVVESFHVVVAVS
jgi:hypothetical protein